jgi:hypothetical protein
MLLERVLEIVKERGLSIRLKPDGNPGLFGPKAEASAALLGTLKLFRGEIVEMLKKEAPPSDPLAAPPPAEIPDFARPIECLWANGYRGSHSFPESGWPIGSRYWRYVGESNWRRIPGVKLSPIEPLDADGNPIPRETGDDA